MLLVWFVCRLLFGCVFFVIGVCVWGCADLVCFFVVGVWFCSFCLCVVLIVW